MIKHLVARLTSLGKLFNIFREAKGIMRFLNEVSLGKLKSKRSRFHRAAMTLLLLTSITSLGLTGLSLQSPISRHNLGPVQRVSSTTGSFGLWVGSTDSNNYPVLSSYSPTYTNSGGIKWITANSKIDLNDPAGNEHLNDMAISTNGTTALTTASNSSASDLDITSLISNFSSSNLSDAYGGNFQGVAVSPSGKWGYAVDYGAGTDSGNGLLVINMATLGIMGYMSGTDTFGVTACADGTHIATLDLSGDLNVFSVSSTGSLTSVGSEIIGSSPGYLTCINGNVEAEGGGDVYIYNILSNTMSSGYAPPVSVTALNTESVTGSNLYLKDGSNNIWEFMGSGFQEVMSASQAPSGAEAVDAESALAVLGSSCFVSNSGCVTVPSQVSNPPMAIAYGVVPQTGPGVSPLSTLGNVADSALGCFTCGGGEDTSELADEAMTESSAEIQDEVASDEDVDLMAGFPVNTATGNFTYSLPSITLPGLGPKVSFTPTYNSLNRSNRGSSQGQQDLGYGVSAGPGPGVEVNKPWIHDYTMVLQGGSNVVFSPMYLINSVSCVSSTFCEAVDATGRSLKYNGTSWSAASTIDSTHSINSVSCVSSSFCEAVDADGNVLNYNGTSWSTPLNIDSTHSINSVSCVSSTFCEAVDATGRSLKYNGTSWSAASTIDSTHSINSVSCVSSSFCEAVDADGNVLNYNGTSWSTPLNIDSTHSINSVSCVSSTFCEAVDATGRSLKYNGTSWSAASTIDSTHSINSVSCVSSSFCEAVDADGNVLNYNGTSWSTPLNIDSTHSINSVSCVSSSFCEAVDADGNVLNYNGTSWSTPLNIDSTHSINSVSCVSSSFCEAVDADGNVLNYNGTWSAASSVESNCASNTYALDKNDYLGVGTPYCVNTNDQAEFYVGSSTSTYTYLNLRPYEVYTFCNSSTGCTVGSDIYANNELESIQDKNGELVTVTYPVSPTSVVYTAASGRTLTEDLNSSGQVTSVTDGERTWGFTYATSTTTSSITGDLISATLSAPAPTVSTGSVPGGPSSYTWSFSYDETSSLNAMLTVTDPNSNTQLTNGYDDASSTSTYFGFTTSQTDALGRETKFSYAGLDPSTTTGSVVMTDPVGNETVLMYANGALIAKTKGYGTSVASTELWSRDPATSRSTQYLDPNGRISTVTVDGFGRLVSFTDPVGNEVYTSYVVSNANNYVPNALSLKELFAPAWNSSAVANSQSGPPAPREVIQHAYDGNGNLDCTLDDTDPTISGGVPAPDDTISTTCSDGDSDSSGTAEPVTSYSTCTISTGCTVGSNTYKPGELESKTDPNAGITTYAYNTEGDLTSSIDAANNETTYSYCTTTAGCTATIGTVTYTYYSGELETAVSPNGNVSGCGCGATYTTSYAYNPYGKQIETVSPEVNGVSAILWNTYDANGNLTITTNDVDGSSDTGANESIGDNEASTDYGSGSASSTVNPESITTYEFDSANQLCWSTMQAVSSPSCSTIPTGYETKSYTYDKDGKVTSVASADGMATDYSYDPLERLSAQLTDPDNDYSNELSSGVLMDADTTSDQTGATEVLTTYSYDQASNMVKAVTSTGITNVYSYDPRNEPTVTVPGDPGGSSSLTSIGCGSATFCITGGSDQSGNPLLLTSGTPFSQDSLSNTSVSVSCYTTSACTTVGEAGNYSGAAYSSAPGTSWSAASTIPSSTLSLANVSCASASDCWAVGQDPWADILDTTNGGSTWTSQSSNVPGEAGNLSAISCLPDATQGTTNCLAIGTSTIGAGSVLSLATTNGGTTWTDQGILSGISELSSVTCTSTSDCWVVGATPSGMPVSYYTTTFGTSWTEITVPTGVTNLNSISCVVNGTNINCVATGAATTTSVCGGTTKTCAITLYSSGAAAQSWSSTIVIPTGVTSLSSVSCVLNGIATTCGASGANSGTSAVITTTNGGTSWSTQSITTTSLTALNSISCALIGTTVDCSTTGVNKKAAASAYGAIGGTSWSDVSVPMTSAAASVTSVADITCPSTSDCFATGANGTSPTVIQTTNSAESWYADTMPSNVTSLAGITCPSTSDCFAVGDNGSSLPAVIQTTNGGTTWTTATMPANVTSLYSVTCTSTSDCFAAGDNGSSLPAVIQTTNGGTTWTTETMPGSVTSLDSISCVVNGANTDCVASGANGTTAVTMYSTNGGSTWTEVTPSSVTSLNGVSCALNGSATDCYAVGANGSSEAIIATTNGGSSWTGDTVPTGLTNLTSISCTASSSCMTSGTTGASGQVLSTTNSGTYWSYQITETAYSYDENGLVTTMTDGQGTTGDVNYTYDGLGRMTSSTDEEGNITTYGYDKVGNKTCVGYLVSSTTACASAPSTSNHVVDYTYDAANRMTSLETWLTNASGPDSVSCYRGVTLPANDTTYFGYDHNGNMTCEALPVTDSTSTDAIGLSFSYFGDNTYNQWLNGTFQGNTDVATYTRNGAGMDTGETLVSNGTTQASYYNTYDQLGRVSAQGTSANPSAQYTYDSAGNVTCMNGSGEVYNAIGALGATTSSCPSSNDVNRYGYDTSGNRTSNCGDPDASSDTSPDGCGYSPDSDSFEIGTFQTYNSLGEMTSYSVPLTKINYTYSGSGLLLTDGTYTLTWDTSQSPKVLSDGSYDYIYSPSGRLMEVISGTTQKFPLTDAIGSVRLEIGTNGAPSSIKATYSPWGSATPSSSPNIGYAGQWIDPESGFYLMGNRFYDTSTAQFLTPDPANTLVAQPYGFAGFNSSLNNSPTILSPLQVGDPTQAYSYAQDDPLNLTDPSGEGIPIPLLKAAVSICAALGIGCSTNVSSTAQSVADMLFASGEKTALAIKGTPLTWPQPPASGNGCDE